MKTFLSYVLISFSLLFFVSCSNFDPEEIVPCDKQNIEIIKSIAQKYGYNDFQIDYKGQRFTPLTKEEMDSYEAYFKELKGMDGVTFEMKQKPLLSRATESFSYIGSVGYEGNSYKVMVYWMKDNQTGEISHVEGGLGGSSIDEYPYPDMVPPIANGIVYTLFYQGKTIHSVGGGIIDITLKADYITKRYKMVNGCWVLESIYYQLTTKVAAYGRVDTNSFSGSFTMQSAGNGSWIER